MSINGHDKSGDGKTSIAIKDHGGKVILEFPNPVTWIALDPQNAFEIAEATARAAHTAKFGKAPPDDRSYLAQQVRARLTDELRDRMVVRVRVMLPSLLDNSRSLDYVARQVVDQIFSEVDR